MSQAFSFEVRSPQPMAVIEAQLRQLWSGVSVDGVPTTWGTMVFCFAYFYRGHTSRASIASIANYLQSVADPPEDVWYWTSCALEALPSSSDKHLDLELLYSEDSEEVPRFPEDDPWRFRLKPGIWRVVDGVLKHR